MRRKNWEKMAAVAGIVFLAAAVALMPTCGGGGGGGSTGPTSGACDLLPGDWDITTEVSGKITGPCGGLKGLLDEPAVINIADGQMTLEITSLGFSAVGPVTCDGDTFDYTGTDSDYPDPLQCSTTLTIVDGTFTSNNDFNAAMAVVIMDVPPATCGSPCSGTLIVTAVRQ